jgi:hypothetical protein
MKFFDKPYLGAHGGPGGPDQGRPAGVLCPVVWSSDLLAVRLVAMITIAATATIVQPM